MMLRLVCRRFSQEASKSEGEQKLAQLLRHRFQTAPSIDVEDISGGCGSMYQVSVVSEEFKGLPLVKQHKLVNETLKKEIKDMHGLRIFTSVPKS